MKTIINQLNLVYPPITFQEAMWLKEEHEVVDYIKNAKIYMIVQREVLKIDDFSFDKSSFTFRFRIKMGNISSPFIEIYLSNIIEDIEIIKKDLVIEISEKIFRVTKESENKVIYWFSPDVFLYYLWRNKFILGENVYIDGDFDFKVFTEFKLHYIGKTVNCIFDRLFKGHHALSKISLKEIAINNNTKLEDELMLLMFEMNPLNINVLEDNVLEDLFYTASSDKLVSDVEKAFINILKPIYNKTLYKQYPRSKDGLNTDNVDSYMYLISEDILLRTYENEIKGRYISDKIEYIDYADCIMIRDNEVKLLRGIEEIRL